MYNPIVFPCGSYEPSLMPGYVPSYFWGSPVPLNSIPGTILFPEHESWRALRLSPGTFPHLPNLCTEQMLSTNWRSFSPTLLKKRNVIYSLTGEKLDRTLKAIFQERQVNSGFSNIDIYSLQGIPAMWVHKIFNRFWIDMASLWAYLFSIDYLNAIDALYEYLEAHADLGDITKDGKPYWVAEGHPLALDTPAPYFFDPLFTVAPISFVAGYFWRTALIGCACKFEHPLYGCFEMFYTLMRRYDRRMVQWVPCYPPSGHSLFFQKDFVTDATQHLIFVEDEFFAYKIQEDWKQLWGAYPTETVALSFPGKLPSLALMDLSIAEGRQVTIELPDENQFTDRELIGNLIRAFSRAKVSSLLFQHTPTQTFRTRETLMVELDIQVASEGTVTISSPFITPAGQDIPGSDIERHALLTTLLLSGFIAWIYGPEKSGKGWLAILFAHVLAKGGSLFGHFDAPERRRVLLIDGESLPDLLTEKIQKVLHGVGSRCAFPGE